MICALLWWWVGRIACKLQVDSLQMRDESLPTEKSAASADFEQENSDDEPARRGMNPAVEMTVHTPDVSASVSVVDVRTPDGNEEKFSA
jgi:hypothetical protein